MRSKSGFFESILLVALLVFCLFLIADKAMAQDLSLESDDEIEMDSSDEIADEESDEEADEVADESEPEIENNSAQASASVDQADGKIEVIYPAEAQAPYRERRGPWSTVFSVNVDQILPENFKSKVSNNSYEDLFGSEPIPLVQIHVGAKYNFGLGALAGTVLIGQGEISDNKIGSSRDLNLMKKGVAGSFILDALFPEPYVAPYVEAQFFTFDWSEGEDASAPAGPLPSKAGSTEFSSAIVAGLLLQMNWLDKDASIQSHNEIGLNNAYLDLFISQYNTSGSEDDPDLATATNFGAGLRLEF